MKYRLCSEIVEEHLEWVLPIRAVSGWRVRTACLPIVKALLVLLCVVFFGIVRRRNFPGKASSLDKFTAITVIYGNKT